MTIERCSAGWRKSLVSDLTPSSQHEPAGIDIVHAAQRDRRLVVGIGVGAEDDERVGSVGEVTDLPRRIERLAAVDAAEEREGLIAVGRISVGIDRAEVDEIALRKVEILDQVRIENPRRSLGGG